MMSFDASSEVSRNLELMRDYEKDYRHRYRVLYDALYLMITPTLIVELDVASGVFTEHRLPRDIIPDHSREALANTSRVLL